MNNKIVPLIMLLGVLLVPMVALAQPVPEQAREGYTLLVPCEGGQVIPGTDINGSAGEKECTFKDFMLQINHIVNLLLYIAVLLSIISFIYAGFKLLFSGGNEDALKQAKHIFWSVLVGLVLAYGAWAIVHFFVTTVGLKDNEGYNLLK